MKATGKNQTPSPGGAPRSESALANLRRVQARLGIPSTGPNFPDPLEPVYGPKGKRTYPSKVEIAKWVKSMRTSSPP